MSMSSLKTFSKINYRKYLSEIKNKIDKIPVILDDIYDKIMESKFKCVLSTKNTKSTNHIKNLNTQLRMMLMTKVMGRKR